MTVTTGARTGVTLWDDPDDAVTRAHFQSSHAAIESKMAVDVQQALPLPSPSIRGRYVWATDDRGGRLWRDTGTTFVDLGPKPITGPTVGSYTAQILASSLANVSDDVLRVRGKTGQTGPLEAWYNDVGTRLASLVPDGTLNLLQGSLVVATGQTVKTEKVIDLNATTLHSIDLRNGGPPRLITVAGSAAGWGVNNQSSSLAGFLVDNPAGMTGDLQRWNVGGSILARFLADGTLELDNGGLNVTTGQTVQTEKVVDINGTVLHSIDLRDSGPPRLITAAAAGNGWGVNNLAAGKVGFIVDNPAGQTAALQRWNIGGAVKAVITADPRLGVGTSAPLGTITAHDNTSFHDGQFKATRPTTADSMSLVFGAASLAFDYIIGRAGSSDDLVFDTWNGVTVVEQVRMTTAGDVKLTNGGEVQLVEAQGAVRYITGAGGRVVYQDTAHVYLGAIDNTVRDTILRAGTTNALVINTTTLSGRVRHLYHGVGQAGTGANLHVDSQPYGGATDVLLRAEADGGVANLFLQSQGGAGVTNIVSGAGTVLAQFGDTAVADPVYIPGPATIDTLHVGALTATAMTPPTVHTVGAAGEPAFKNFWAAYGGPSNNYGQPRFWKDADGTVHLAGTLQVGAGHPSADVVAFTLPVGFRPTASNDAEFSAVVGSIPSRIDVRSNGDVAIGIINNPPDGSYAGLDGITFPTFG